MMNVFAKAGVKVRYLGASRGQEDERDEIESLGVKEGDVLTVSFTRVGKFSTGVAFEEIAGLHNSVLFEQLA